MGPTNLNVTLLSCLSCTNTVVEMSSWVNTTNAKYVTRIWYQSRSTTVATGLHRDLLYLSAIVL